ncbi:PAS domain S-box protein, partial [Acidisphaera sp. L21]|uniref:PAS domain-containing protein n=1 Tax=Acidisphaera sp. L21 TaxID=1641851 RepID=UPI001C202C4E
MADPTETAIASNQRYRAILDSAADIAIIAIDPDGRVTNWSAGAERLFDWSEAEMRGQTLDRLFTPEAQVDRLPNFEMRRSLEAGRVHHEGWRLRRDGSRFWARGEMTVLRSPAGGHLGFVKILTDRTKPHHDAQTLRETMALNALILTASRDSIIVLDLDGHIQTANPGAAEPALTAGSLWAGLWQGAARRMAEDALAQARAGDLGRVQGAYADDPARWWDVALSRLPGEDGWPARLVAVGRDITALRRADIRRTALLELGDRLRMTDDVSEMSFVAAQIMGRTLDSSAAGYGTMSQDGLYFEM